MFKSDFKGLFICVGPPYVYIFFFSVPVPWSESEFLVFWVSLWLLHLAPATCNSKSSQRRNQLGTPGAEQKSRIGLSGYRLQVTGNRLQVSALPLMVIGPWNAFSIQSTFRLVKK